MTIYGDTSNTQKKASVARRSTCLLGWVTALSNWLGNIKLRGVRQATTQKYVPQTTLAKRQTCHGHEGYDKRKKRRYRALSIHRTTELTSPHGWTSQRMWPKINSSLFPFFAFYGLTSFSYDGVDLIAQTWQQTGKDQMSEVCDVINKMTLVSLSPHEIYRECINKFQ